MMSQFASQRRLLAVTAHPDDETFGPGGTLALYARRGVGVYVVCATRGEVGEAPAGLRGYASIAEMREAELRCASQVLGVKEVRLLGYRDSGMAGTPENAHPGNLANAPLQEVALKVARHMREIRPQVIITSDPGGGYGHPDHIAVSRATVEAARLAGDPGLDIEGLPPYSPQKLYYHTLPLRGLKRVVHLLERLGVDTHHFGKNRDIDLTAIARDDWPVHAVISIRPVAEIKQQASACHASQGGGMPRGALGWAFRLLGGNEQFSRALTAEPPLHVERDLFEGVREG
jgi:LmbE family N-acetylglucosaminyl deacetylase